MDFGWLKRIFKKKNLSYTNTSDISTIDTSFICVPKLSELSDENKLLVKKYLQEIRTDEYESVLKYSEELLNKSNSEIECFMTNINEIIKDISSVINEVNKENYFKMLLNKEEITQSIDEFYKIIDESKLRLIALDMYIKKEEKRKYDFLGIFGKDERLKYLLFKNRLLNERDRLRITIKIASQHLLATFKALKEEETLLNKMEGYINSSKSFNIKRCDNQVCQKYAEKLLVKKKIIHNSNCQELEYLIDVCEDVYGIDHGLCVSYVSDEKMNMLLSNLEYEKIIPFLVREKRFIKKYAYEHRNDYKKIIEEINELIHKYEITSSSKWNKKKLEKTIRKYLTKTTNYVILCKNYINDDILAKLKESIFHLNYFFYISEIRRNKKDDNMSPLGKSLILGEYTSPIIHNELLRDVKGWNWDYDDEKIYYDSLSAELLKTVGILNLPIYDYKRLDKRKNAIVSELKNREEIHYLFDIYNNDYDSFDLDLNTYAYNNRVKKHNGIFEHYKLDLYLKTINQKYLIDKSSCFIAYDENVSLDDIYYLDKLLNSKGWIIEELFNDEYGLEQGMSKELFKILVYSYLRNKDLKNDDRIFVIPRQIQFDIREELELVNKQNITDNNIAIYVSNLNQAITIHDALKAKKLNIKYLMMSDDIDEDYEDIFGCDLEPRTEIIRVPNHTRYNALTMYLDQELAQEQEQQKVLSKTL